MAATVPDTNNYLRYSVQDLLSLKGRVTVITGGARGLGLAFTLAVAEVGGSVAILDAADEPHEHYHEIQKRFPDVKLGYYKYDSNPIFLAPSGSLITIMQDGCDRLRPVEEVV